MATQRPFHFAGGVLAVQSRAEWVEQMRKTEAQGFATLLLVDHFEPHWFPLPPGFRLSLSWLLPSSAVKSPRYQGSRACTRL